MAKRNGHPVTPCHLPNHHPNPADDGVQRLPSSRILLADGVQERGTGTGPGGAARDRGGGGGSREGAAEHNGFPVGRGPWGSYPPTLSPTPQRPGKGTQARTLKKSQYPACCACAQGWRGACGGAAGGRGSMPGAHTFEKTSKSDVATRSQPASSHRADFGEKPRGLKWGRGRAC